MAKLPPESLEGKDLNEILTTLGKKFLGEDVALTSFEELKAGVSYNYKVQFGDKKFILKVDNPTKNLARANLNGVSGDERPNNERFDLIARFVNEKVARGLQAPAFLPVVGTDGKFCVTNGADDESLPKEFRGAVVSMQPFLEKGKSVHQTLSASEARSLGDNLGKLHRPTPLAQKFPVPLESPRVARFTKQRQDLRDQFGATKEERAENYETSSVAIERYMTSLASSKDEAEQKLHTEMLQYFPNGNCSAETLGSVIETACALQPKQNLSQIRQISHNDLHGGNMLVDGNEATLIDFDELGRAGLTEDLWMQVEPVLNTFRRGETGEDLPPRQELLEEFLCGYLAHNPYLSRLEFQSVRDLTKMVVAGESSQHLAAVVKQATSTTKPTEEEVKNLTNLISDMAWMPALLADGEKQKEEKDLLGVTYDKVFAEISKGTSLETLDLATPHKPSPNPERGYAEKMSQVKGSRFNEV